MKASSTLGGIAGALALTLLNEGVRKISKDAPRLDLLGQNALAKMMKGNELIPKTAQKFFPLAGDLVTNSLFYGMAKGTSPRNTLLRGALLGLTAGIGALTLPKHLGLKEEYTNRNTKQAIMTVGWYVIGGLVAAAVMNVTATKTHTLPEDKQLKSGVKNIGKKAGKELAKVID
jgi:hypothetical protein